MTMPGFPPRPRSLAAAAIGVLLGVAALAFLYATLKPADKVAGAASCPAASQALAGKLKGLATGGAASVVVASDPHQAMPLAFERHDGSKTTLADFRGRAVLLNLWATWCVPCRAEMPALDRLEAGRRRTGFRGRRGQCRHRAARAARRLSRRDRRQGAGALCRSERRRVRDPAQGRQGARPAGVAARSTATAARSPRSPARSSGIRRTPPP